MPNRPIHPGVVAWTGEDPGLYLKDEQDGPWTGLMTLFRFTWSVPIEWSSLNVRA